MDEDSKGVSAPNVSSEAGAGADEEVVEDIAKPGWVESFRVAFDRARREQKPKASRGELSRDKSKSFLVLGAGAVIVLLLFFGLFSSPKKKGALAAGQPGQPNLGRKVTPGTENAAGRNITPILDADTRSENGGLPGEVTPEDVGRTSRLVDHPALPPATAPTGKPSPAAVAKQDYALRNVDFPGGNTVQPGPPPSLESATDLKTPSIVFVRSASSAPAVTREGPVNEGNALEAVLPAGTRLVARLEAPVSSAAPAPVVAVIEYNYEHDGEIVLPAGAKAVGKLAQVNSSGIVGIQFEHIEMPDGTVERLAGTAMDLKFGPLKGYVSGRKRGTNFLVRSMTGLGTVAAYTVGSQGGNGFNGPISETALLRERLADNVGTAGQEELNSLGLNQNLVVTVPGNTRFYLVVEKSGNDGSRIPGAKSAGAKSTSLAGEKVPTLEELRELMELRREVNQMYQQATAQTGVETNAPNQ
jgi:hypothetical protein